MSQCLQWFMYKKDSQHWGQILSFWRIWFWSDSSVCELLKEHSLQRNNVAFGLSECVLLMCIFKYREFFNSYLHPLQICTSFKCTFICLSKKTWLCFTTEQTLHFTVSPWAVFLCCLRWLLSYNFMSNSSKADWAVISGCKLSLFLWIWKMCLMIVFLNLEWPSSFSYILWQKGHSWSVLPVGMPEASSSSACTFFLWLRRSLLVWKSCPHVSQFHSLLWVVWKCLLKSDIPRNFRSHFKQVFWC